jgi:lysophospholipase L1-like esterase
MRSFFYSFKGRLILLCLMQVLFPASVPLAGKCPETMISYWGLGEAGPPFYDSIGYPEGNNASCSSCPASVDNGVVGRAALFMVERNMNLTVPAHPSMNWSGVQSFSIQLWLRPDGSWNGEQRLIGRKDVGFFWDLGIRDDGTVRFRLNDGLTSMSLASTKALAFPSARWHHVAVVRDGPSGETQLFMDGLPQDSVRRSFAGNFSSDDAPIAIGWSGDEGDALRFNGSLDEIAIYGRTLTHTEVRSHYYLSRHYCELYDYPVDMMPLGDSITYGNYAGDPRPDGERVAYRYSLSQRLTESRYLFDFIGSQQAGQNYEGFDPDHAGFSGITPAQLATLMRTSYYRGRYVVQGLNVDTPYLENFPSDVILLHIGTNGLTNAGVISDYVDGVRAILDEIDSYSPHITVLVARIILRASEITDTDPNGTASITHLFNEALEQMIIERVAAGDKLIMVDMERGAGLTYALGEDMLDDLHPNESGYDKMAAHWQAHLNSFVPPVELPVITSSPVGSVAAGQIYRYQVIATGMPKPFYRLEIYPDGMIIDDESGLITWSAPDSAGDWFTVRVTARNLDPMDAVWARDDTQEFSILITENNDTSHNPVINVSSGSSGCLIQSIKPSYFLFRHRP